MEAAKQPLTGRDSSLTIVDGGGAMSGNRVAIFGASGAIGMALAGWFSQHGWDVICLSRSGKPPVGVHPIGNWIVCDPQNQNFTQSLRSIELPLHAAVWAQGANFNDNLETFDAFAHEQMYRANVTYILMTLQGLLNEKLLSTTARLCVVSSVWQNLARQNKLSYSITKSALHGLILSASLELGRIGHLINAVLPGALDTPMTRANLNEAQIRSLAGLTYFNKLPAMGDVCEVVGFLCSPANAGITGQFIAVDQGFSHVRII